MGLVLEIEHQCVKGKGLILTARIYPQYGGEGCPGGSAPALQYPMFAFFFIYKEPGHIVGLCLSPVHSGAGQVPAESHFRLICDFKQSQTFYFLCLS